MRDGHRPAEGGREAGEALAIGLISDTHGFLRNEIYAAFEGVDEIIHAGDVGDAAILTELEVIAPVSSVYGNVDGWEVRERSREVLELERAGHRIAVIHGHQLGAPKVEGLIEMFPDAGVIVYGHTHQALVRNVGKALVVNPGSAGHRRFGKPVTAAQLVLRGQERPQAMVIELA
jgi:putative phosphoesterase